MKRIISFFLVLVLLSSVVPFSVIAASVEDGVSTTEAVNTSVETGASGDEYIYYSDLFYAYSSYLTGTKNPYLTSFNYNVLECNTMVLNEYVTTPHFVLSATSEGLDIATSPDAFVKEVLDNIGLTSFRYNDELDAANLIFVTELMDVNLSLKDASSQIGAENKIVKNINSFLKNIQKIDAIALENEAYYSPGSNKADVYYSIFEQSLAYYEDYFTQISPKLPSFKTRLHTTLAEITPTLGAISDAAEFTKKILIALMMQEAELELINDILATQSSSSDLYKGMSRLKTQLQNGIVNYYAIDFVANKVYDEVIGDVSSLVNKLIMGQWASYYSVVTGIVKLMNTVVLEWILKADYSEYTTNAMLRKYSMDLYDGLKNKANVFTATFSNSEIDKYQRMFEAYVAMSNASMESCKSLAKYNSEYDEVYCDIMLGAFADMDTYEEYIESTKRTIKDIAPENRIVTDFGDWTLTGHNNLFGASDIILNGIHCGDAFKGNLNMGGSAQDGHCTVTIPADCDVKINGDVKGMTKYDTLVISGKLTVNGIYASGGSASTNYYSHIYNYNEFTVLNELDIEYTYLNQSDNAKLYISGNYSFSGRRYDDCVNGTIIFNGTEQQKVSGLDAKNVDVQNKEGIFYYAASIYGEYKLNGNPLGNEESITYIHNGCSFDQVSNYGELIAIGSVTLRTGFTGNLNMGGSEQDGHCTVTIPADRDVKINGDVKGMTKYDTLVINGKLTVNGIYASGGSSSSRYYSHIYNYNEFTVLNEFDIEYTFLNQSDNAKLYISGDYSFTRSGYDDFYEKGTIIFNGTKQQKASGVEFLSIIIENTSAEGVVFSYKISPTILFDHRGNNFTLYNNGSGSTFVDYDGDGMKDNVDPQPTVGNPCTLCFESDTEKGTVSIDKIEAIGGTSVTVTATPTFKYNFTKWVNSSGATMSTSPQWTFVAKSKDETYTAIFSKRQQPITTQCDGGIIDVIPMAEIDSEVNVIIAEDDGYVYTQGSLSYNGTPIENGSFIMPDEHVVITAEFVRNENYFLLDDMITSAKGYTYESYSKDSFDILTDAIASAEEALVNHITEMDSDNHIQALQSAIDALEDKYVTNLAFDYSPMLFVNVPDLINDAVIVVTYDNSTTEYISATECTITNYDCTKVGEQMITLEYGGVTAEETVFVEKRWLWDCDIAGIEDQIFDGVKTEYTLEDLTLTYWFTGEVLEEGVDYTVEYFDNTTIGLATVVFTGVGDYEESLYWSYEIYCEHSTYECTERVEASCTQSGYLMEQCSICKEKRTYQNVVTEGLPESPHNYANSCDVSYYYTDLNATSLVLKFSSSTLTESNYDYIYIYNGAGTQVGKYSGSSLSGKSITVAGDTVRIRLTSDGSVVKYGFSLTSITSVMDRSIIPMLGHTEVVDEGYEATYEHPGLTDGSHCSECGEILVPQEIIPIILMIGDVDGDSVVSIMDATLIQMHVAELIEIGVDRLKCVDTDKDGAVTILDATRIQMYLADLISEL